MRIDNLFQFIVPLTFLTIWALTSLFNREAQPLPPRANRPPGPPGPRPGLPPAPGPVERRAEPATGEPTMRWSTETATVRRAPGRPDDDILIIESEPRRASPAPSAAPASRTGGGASARRGSRTRSATPSSPKRPEPSTPRALSAEFGQGIANQVNHPLNLGPLAMPQSTLGSHDLPSIAKVVSEPPRPVPGRALPLGIDLQVAMSSPAKLRESFIMNELFQPPLALRGKRSRRP
ncbi:MAG: hypothetical protein JO284_20245 [Planctomycetaceae bacterium]|nr:hypothetical protein [Planctomycetaceae bacterium]